MQFQRLQAPRGIFYIVDFFFIPTIVLSTSTHQPKPKIPLFLFFSFLIFYKLSIIFYKLSINPYKPWYSNIISTLHLIYFFFRTSFVQTPILQHLPPFPHLLKLQHLSLLHTYHTPLFHLIPIILLSSFTLTPFGISTF